MLKQLWKNKITRFCCIMIIGILVALLQFAPYIYRFLTEGVIFSGNGDGFRQMMPFQMYLYEHFTSFHSFYDHSFGLGGDYVKDLSYYYATSPFTYINFVVIWLASHLFHLNPHDIGFWPGNQLIVAFVKTVFTYTIAFYYFRSLNLKFSTVFLAALLYGASTIVIYFNFTWSFYGDLLIILPLSLLGIERYFKQRKLALFIFAIALTLFSNFYFSYFQALALTFYFCYRLYAVHPNDIVTRWQKFYTLSIAVALSILVAIWGFYTGVSSFLNNDRKANPDFHINLITDFARQTHFFSNGFYITVTAFALVALFAFKLYRHYYYKMFAIATWIMLLGALTPYFDSMFNGFSTPQRRWIYLFALSTAILTALFVQYMAELSLKTYIYACIPALLIIATMSITVTTHKMNWMIVCIIIMIFVGYLIYNKQLITKRWALLILLALFVIQQGLIVKDYHFNNIKKYENTFADLDDSSYRSKVLSNKIDAINKSYPNDLLNRIDYMSHYGLNSPMIYHFNGIALYSSIFDGDILNYYDKQLQINMHTDKNSTYRLLSNRANLMSLWNVKDRIRRPNDLNMPYGFKQHQRIKDGKAEFIHSKNEIDYPSAHITSKVYDQSDLKSPLDKEQAMLQGVTFQDDKHVNASFKANDNLLSQAQQSMQDAYINNKEQLVVTKNNGGIEFKLPQSVAKQYKDMYVELDIQLLAPNKEHYVGINEYKQTRNELDYKYRRLVNPVTMRVKANDVLKLKLAQGTYKYRIKGIYGENYETLHQSAQTLHKVDIAQRRDGYKLTKRKQDKGYIVLPMAYREGMFAKSNGKEIPVLKGNGIMTVIPAEKGQETLTLHYRPPYFWPLIILSGLGILLSVGFTIWIRKKQH